MSEQYQTISNCNMRQEPSAKAAIGAVVQAGQIVHVERIEAGWARVQVINGWISSELLRKIET